jgi:integrase/recombinase XerD
MSLIQKWGEYYLVNKGRSPGTITKYSQNLNRLGVFLATKERAITHANQDDLIEFTGSYCWHVLKLNSAARKPVIAAVKAFYEWAFEFGYTLTDPAKKLEYPKLPRRIPTALGLQNLERIMAQPDLSTFIGLRDLAILSTLAGTGLRISGVVSLNVESFVQYQDTAGTSRLAVRVIEKGDKERMLPIPMELQLILTAYLNHPYLQEVDRTTHNGQNVLWISTANRTVPVWEYTGEARRLGSRSIDELIKTYGEEAGIPPDQLHAHAFRHLFGTELAEDDVDDTNRADFLGHSSVDTVRIYTHMAMRKKTSLIDKANPLGKIHTAVTSMLGKAPARISQ